MKCYKCGVEMEPGTGDEHRSEKYCYHHNPEVCIGKLQGRLEAIETRLEEMRKDGQLTIEEIHDILGEDF